MKTLTWLVMLATTSSITETLTFDSAAIGKTPKGWVAANCPLGVPPSWKVVKDPSAPTQPYVLAHVPAGQPGYPFPIVLLDEPPCRDGEISVKFKTLSGKREQDAGLIWRFKDPDHYYLVRADASENNVVLYKVVNGKPHPLFPRSRVTDGYAVRHNVSADAWSILKVVFKGNSFSVYYDHRRILQVEDSTFNGPGKVGLWTRDDSVAYFDNFRFTRK